VRAAEDPGGDYPRMCRSPLMLYPTERGRTKPVLHSHVHSLDGMYPWSARRSLACMVRARHRPQSVCRAAYLGFDRLGFNSRLRTRPEAYVPRTTTC
jgi:hypothetical protein